MFTELSFQHLSYVQSFFRIGNIIRYYLFRKYSARFQANSNLSIAPAEMTSCSGSNTASKCVRSDHEVEGSNPAGCSAFFLVSFSISFFMVNVTLNSSLNEG